MWIPWIDPNYKSQQLLLLGESCYDWTEKDGTRYRPEPDHPIRIVKDSRKSPRGHSATMIKLTRALCNCGEPTPEQASAAWDKVAFTNYVPVSVGDGASIRPDRSAWKQGKQEWETLLNEISPRLVIVLGLTLWNRMPKTQVVVSERVQGYRLKSGDISLCHAVHHPSFGPSWTEYAALFANILKNDLPPTQHLCRQPPLGAAPAW